VPDPAQIGVQSSSSKQARVTDDILRTDEAELIRYACNQAFTIYRELLARGVPRELARSVLPVSTYSHMFAKIDLRNLLGFLDLRLHEHAQYEIRVYAEAMLQLARSVAPVCIEAWESGR
jgi:thymidylate synthase (FAD)